MRFNINAPFSAVNQWNSFQDTLIYMTDSKLYSLQYLLYTYINQASALANAAKANSPWCRHCCCRCRRPRATAA